MTGVQSLRAQVRKLHREAARLLTQQAALTAKLRDNEWALAEAEYALQTEEYVEEYARRAVKRH